MHSCNSFPELPDTINKCGFFPSQIGSRIGQAQDLPLWAASMPGRPPCRLQCPPRPRPPERPCPERNQNSRRAGRNGPIRRAITLPFFLQNSPNSQEMSAMQSSSRMPIFSFLPQILRVQKHQPSRRDMDPAVFKLPASRGRDT